MKLYLSHLDLDTNIDTIELYDLEDVELVLDNILDFENLQYLCISHCKLINTPNLSSLKYLNEISLNCCNLSDISFLNGVTVGDLKLMYNNITDISDITSNGKIYEADLRGNKIESLDLDHVMQNIDTLILYENPISNIKVTKEIYNHCVDLTVYFDDSVRYDIINDRACYNFEPDYVLNHIAEVNRMYKLERMINETV